MITIIGEVGRPATQEEIDQFVNTKDWSEMAEQEIYKLKKKQCTKCKYFSHQNGKQAVSAVPCDYLLITGHSRGCSPLDCVSYDIFKLAKDRKRRKFKV